MSSTTNKNKSYLAVAVLSVVALMVGYGLITSPGSAAFGEQTEQQTSPPPAGFQRATFAAGCFWSMEAIFKQLKGVDSVYPGYAGGTLPHPSYELVETGDTGYAETVNITYDPKVISYQDLLRVLLIARNPTTLNQQGPDAGTQYRSIIFYRTDQEKNEANQVIKEVENQHVWQDPIVTEVIPFKTFYRAESYHLNYYNLHPNQDYCAYVIAPEIANFRAKFKNLLKS